MRRFLFWSLCFCLLFPVGLSSCDGSDSAAVIFGGTTGKLTWTLTEDGVLTITGEGPMPDYRDGGTSETPPWYPHVNRISSLTIGEGVTRIGDYAFMLCSFVTEVVIPESVTSMGDWAFWHCQSLKRITFPDRMVRFGEWAFYENESLQSVCIPEGVTTIPSSAFARCHNLTCVIMPGSLQTICGGLPDSIGNGWFGIKVLGAAARNLSVCSDRKDGAAESMLQTTSSYGTTCGSVVNQPFFPGRIRKSRD